MLNRLALIGAVILSALTMGYLWIKAPQRDTAPAPIPLVGPVPKTEPVPPVQTLSPLEAAFRKAKAENKSVVLFFTTPGCVPCEAMKRDVLKDPSVKKDLADNFIFLVVDSAEDPDTVKTYNVSAFPTHIILTSTGQMQRVFVGPMQAVSYEAWLRGQYPAKERQGLFKGR